MNVIYLIEFLHMLVAKTTKNIPIVEQVGLIITHFSEREGTPWEIMRHVNKRAHKIIWYSMWACVLKILGKI